MIALDTNILIYAHREEFPQHKIARDLVKKYCEGSEPWTVPWPCFYEFLRVVTHPRVFNPPTSIAKAMGNIQNIFAAPSFVEISETERHVSLLAETLKQSHLSGNLVFDAHIAALLLEHGIKDIMTADNDFKRFAQLKAHNPFTA